MYAKFYFVLAFQCYFLLNSCVPGETATECLIDDCSIENSCKCTSSNSPITTEETPQLVTLTFTELIDQSVYEQFIKPLLYERRNPDGSSISATFFVSHEFSDYELVHELYINGFEIGVQSISNNQTIHYWKTATEETLAQEFGGQKQILSKFANIPAEDIKGVRTPLYQLNGNVTFNSYIDSGLNYDSSWPTAVAYPLYPYTLDYKTTQRCREGITCPTESFDGFWVLPINSLTGQYIECYNVSECGISGNFLWISEWFQRELNKTRNGNREPLTIILDTNWFLDTALLDQNWNGINDFLSYALNYTDTYFVSHSQVIDWMQNPVSMDEYSTQQPERIYNCEPVTCRLEKGDEFRYMKSCSACPEVYPWVGNPLGER